MSRDKKQLTVHIAAVHEKKKPFECELCNGRFVTRSQSNNHLKENMEMKDHMSASFVTKNSKEMVL